MSVNILNPNILAYRVSRFMDEAGRTRFIANHRQTGSPPLCLSLFEHHQAVSGRSPNSTSKDLYELAYFYTWADLCAFDLDALLLSGTGISESKIRQFSHWLRELKGKNGHSMTPKSFNSVLAQCSRFCVWCAKWAGDRPTGRDAGYRNQMADLAITKAWQANNVRHRPIKMAPDLEEMEIIAIEQYLKPATAIARGEAREVAYRNYLLWHLAIEMGLRLSEILALRLQDCSGYNHNHISIVRIEDRGREYKDPRGVYAPRPKTLSRDLGYIIENSPLRNVLREYISKYRYRKSESGSKQFMLDHDFLILTNQTGRPLSVKAASSIAVDIAKGSGVPKFHWHIARHAFFNRAYAAVAENESHISDLVYYGGWADPSSLQIYVQRALRNRALNAISVWQRGNPWSALTN